MSPPTLLSHCRSSAREGCCPKSVAGDVREVDRSTGNPHFLACSGLASPFLPRSEKMLKSCMLDSKMNATVSAAWRASQQGFVQEPWLAVSPVVLSVGTGCIITLLFLLQLSQREQFLSITGVCLTCWLLHSLYGMAV